MAAVAVNGGAGAIALFEPLYEDPELNTMFCEIGQALHEQHLMWDEVGMICRQITRESKRAVSQVIGYFQNRKALKNTRLNLRNLVRNEKYFPLLAKKLQTLDTFHYARCYSAPLQEFIEAFALWVFFKKGRLVTYEEVQQQLTVTCFEKVEEPEDEDDEYARMFGPSRTGGERRTYSIPVSRADYFLGIADIAGELVRACAAGFHSASFKHFLFSSHVSSSALFNGLLNFSYHSKGLQQKLCVIRASLIKLENACYHAAVDFEKYLTFGAIAVKGLDYYEEEEDEEAEA